MDSTGNAGPGPSPAALLCTSYPVRLFSDPADKKLPLLEKAAFFYREGEEKPAVLAEMEQQVRAADAYIVVSGEYNHSIPPALANMMDYFGGSCYAYKPSGIVCYSPGIYGGMRAAMQLRCFLGELGCLSVSNIFGIPRVHQALGEDGSPIDSHMESGAEKLIKDLDWHAHAMRNHRQTAGKPT